MQLVSFSGYYKQIYELITSTTVLLDKLSNCAQAGTLQQVCCQATKKETETRGKKLFNKINHIETRQG